MEAGAEKQEKRRPWMRLEFSGGGLLVVGGIIIGAAFAAHRARVNRQRNKQRSKDMEHEVADRNKKKSNGEISDGGDGLVEVKEGGPMTLFEHQREEWKEDDMVGGLEEIKEVVGEEKREMNETHAKKGDGEPFANDADEKRYDCVEVEEEISKSCSIEGLIDQSDKKVEIEETDINEDIEEEIFGDETVPVAEKNEGEEGVSNEMVLDHFSVADKQMDDSVEVEEEEVASCNIKEEMNHLDNKLKPEEDEAAEIQPEQTGAEVIDGFEEKVAQIDKIELLVTNNEMEEEDCDEMPITRVNRLREKDQKQERGYEANDSKVYDSIEVKEEKLEAWNNKEEMNRFEKKKEPEEDDANLTDAHIDEVSEELLVDRANQVEQQGYDDHYGRAIAASLEESEEKHDGAEELHEEVASQSNEDSISSVDVKVAQKNEVSDDQFLQIVAEAEQNEIAFLSNVVSGIQVEEELQPNEVQYFDNDVLKEEAVADFEEVERGYDHKQGTVSRDEELDPSKDVEKELQQNEVQYINNEEIVADFEGVEKEDDHKESTESRDEELDPTKDDDDEVEKEEDESDGSGTSSIENAEAVWPADAIAEDEQSSPSLKLNEDDGKVDISQKAGEIVPIARTELGRKSEPQGTTRMQKFVKKVMEKEKGMEFIRLNHHRSIVLLVLVLALVLGFLSFHQRELLWSKIYGQLFFPSNKNVP